VGRGVPQEAGPRFMESSKQSPAVKTTGSGGREATMRLSASDDVTTEPPSKNLVEGVRAGRHTRHDTERKSRPMSYENLAQGQKQCTLREGGGE